MISPADWTDTTLGAIAAPNGGLVDGPFGSNLPASLYEPSGVPVIRGSNLTMGSGRFVSDEFVFVSPATAESLSRCICEQGDVIFTKKGTIGQTGLVPSSSPFERYLLSSNQMRLRVDRTVADPLFIYYAVSSPETRAKIRRDSEATGVPKTNLTYLRSFPIRLPPLAEQRRIARMLGALDDKIELNRRMNCTLESIARAIFKSWFVDFDPVRKKMECKTGGELGLPPDLAAQFPGALSSGIGGEIPEGWPVASMGDIARELRTLRSPGEVMHETPFIGLEHMPRRSIDLSRWGAAGSTTSGKFAFREGDILFGKLRPYFHKVGVAQVDGVCSTDVVVVRPDGERWFPYVLGVLSSDRFVEHVTASSTGTRMPRTNWREMSRFQVVLPPDALVEAFSAVVSPVVKTIRSNSLESRSLEEARDELLPWLVAGSPGGAR